MENPYLLSVIWRQKVSWAVLKPLVLGNRFRGEVGGKFMKLLSYVSGRVSQGNLAVDRADDQGLTL